EAAAQDIAENVRAYLGWLDAHIEKENNILFSIADQHLNEHEQEKLYTQFEQLEEERIGSGVHEQFHRMLDDLKTHYFEPE
ncbi:MAG: hemerythrin, partial [candidate division Zixibacteria bacterium]|nr:hemerythrin [Gammaproteobacteria bacterium]NIT52444.1 hemerythrin [candidate division Zixibacteria bacterium]NIW39927.1 hemerythrin [candidate division Zixibacteria bacterium]NIX59571.1 hemerythrin [candidate division Zixibacteria bacterium]